MYNVDGNYDRIKEFIRRGDILLCDLGEGQGSEQNGIRPCVVIQNDIGNKYSPTVIVAAITSQINKAKLPTHIEVDEKSGLDKPSIILCEQIRTIDKSRVVKYIGSVSRQIREKINNALITSIEVFKKGELIVREQVVKVKTYEEIILNLFNLGVTKEVLEDIVEDYKKELYDLQQICDKNRLYINNYYKINDDMMKIYC